jgi:mercuric reductase
VGAHDGAIAADNALSDARRSTDYRVIPRAVFTDPPVASVGMTDREANEKEFSCRCETIPMELVPRAAAIHRTDGLLKMVAESESGKVLGVHMLGDAAHEVIQEAAMAMRFSATLNDFIDQIHIYPTMAEALKIGALAFTKDVSKLSCCAE